MQIFTVIVVLQFVSFANKHYLSSLRAAENIPTPLNSPLAWLFNSSHSVNYNKFFGHWMEKNGQWQSPNFFNPIKVHFVKNKWYGWLDMVVFHRFKALDILSLAFRKTEGRGLVMATVKTWLCSMVTYVKGTRSLCTFKSLLLTWRQQTTFIFR